MSKEKRTVMLSVPVNSLILVGREMSDESVILFARDCEGNKMSFKFHRPHVPMIATFKLLPIITVDEFNKQPNTWDEIWDDELASKTIR